MKKLPPQEEKIKRAIRDAIVIDPLISVAKLQDALYDKGYRTANNSPLDWDYVAKMRHKVHRQAVESVDHQEVSSRVAEMKERYRLIYEQLIRIAYYSDELRKEGVPPPSVRDRVSALREIIKLDVAIFGAEMDAGIFNRHLGTLEIEKRNKPLPVEARELIKQAMVNWGMIPKELPEHASQDTTKQQPALPERPIL